MLFARREFWIAVYQFGALVVGARIFPDVHKAIGLRRIPFAGNERPEAKKRRKIWEDRKVEALDVAAHSVHPAFARRTSEAWVLNAFSTVVPEQETSYLPHSSKAIRASRYRVFPVRPRHSCAKRAAAILKNAS